ncbi:uncharacterized protein LOC127788215 [Diospyros lotus]|uniref:uncharacterized protein LOC127788215 n=1 Tax=Diospyros lotus TaxID=55363 RepID=UPI002254CAF7|nr:uncharacterized protein LOC127788215 [Diospyros lotus]
MELNKSWINISNRLDPRYEQGIQELIQFAYRHKSPGASIYCPCIKCVNRYFHKRDVVEEHLILNGFDTNYIIWTVHGELYVPRHSREEFQDQECNIGDDMVGMIHDAHGVPINNVGSSEEATRFYELLEEAETELWPGCKNFTTLSFIVRLQHLKVLGGLSDKIFDMLLELLNEAFPEGVSLPRSYREAKKLSEDLGFKYYKYDACPNNYMLFWKDASKLDRCTFCGESRYKEYEVHMDDDITKMKKVASKQVRHFPLISRLQRLFMSNRTTTLMRWHEEGRTKDGIMRHPADSLAWQSFDEQHPKFAEDSRNVRLGLAFDGFNPFRTMTISYSIWPVVLMPYNLPPWLCMKQPYFILSLLIGGPRAPGDNIDVFLQPLIQELQELWSEGIETYDASRKEMFHVHAALLWTINDFLAYANLFGWSTRGRVACPCCMKETESKWLKHGGKFCYMGHRRFLEDMSHHFRLDKKDFDGTIENRVAPPQLSGYDVFKDVEFVKKMYGNRENSGASVGRGMGGWKKHSIFFELPYWQDNLIRHNLEVMHIEKNVCDNIIWTLLMLEMFLLTLKEYVRTRSHPEGSIAEGYLAEECLTFCARYLDDVETKFNRPVRNYESAHGQPIPKKGKLVTLDEISLQQAHHYVLANCSTISSYRETHLQSIRLERRGASNPEITQKHHENFSLWFQKHVYELQVSGHNVPNEVKTLAAGPHSWAWKYSGYIVNGFKFHTRHRERRRMTQNSGVLLTTNTESYASSKDKRPISGDVTFYGVLTDVVEIRYSNEFKFVLFKCDWVDNNRGMKVDSLNFITINFNCLMYQENKPTDEPFILATQASQVWYVADPLDEEWHVVMKMTPRDLYNMGKRNVARSYDEEDALISNHVEINNDQSLHAELGESDEDYSSGESDEDGMLVDISDDDDSSIPYTAHSDDNDF